MSNFNFGLHIKIAVLAFLSPKIIMTYSWEVIFGRNRSLKVKMLLEKGPYCHIQPQIYTLLWNILIFKASWLENYYQFRRLRMKVKAHTSFYIVLPIYMSWLKSINITQENYCFHIPSLALTCQYHIKNVFSSNFFHYFFFSFNKLLENWKGNFYWKKNQLNNNIITIRYMVN
jgi:hypothetical protein